jgi:YfiH family protein
MNTHKNQNSLISFQSSMLHSPHIQHGFFGRHSGASQGNFSSLNCSADKGDEPSNVAENRRRIIHSFSPEPKALCINHQVHSSIVTIVDSPDFIPQNADGFVTRLPLMALGILTADCAPILFYCQDSHVIGACHAGWKGAFGGVIESTIAAMINLGAIHNQICATVGPCIDQKSYEVGDDFYEKFIHQSSCSRRFFMPAQTHGKHLFSLRDYVTSHLETAKIGHVDHIQHDTYSNEDLFFSFRRQTHNFEKTRGDQLSVIMLNHTSR